MQRIPAACAAGFAPNTVDTNEQGELTLQSVSSPAARLVRVATAFAYSTALMGLVSAQPC